MSELEVTRLEAGVYVDPGGLRYVTEQRASEQTKVPRATLRDHGDDDSLAFTRVDRGSGVSPRYLIRESDLPKIRRARQRDSARRGPGRPVEQLFEEMRRENAELTRRLADLEDRAADLHASIASLTEANAQQAAVIGRLNRQLSTKP